MLVVAGSFPSGLISAFIIFIGMRQAWQMTGVPLLKILGPYRVGAAPAPHRRDADTLHRCGTELPPDALACPACASLIHADS